MGETTHRIAVRMDRAFMAIATLRREPKLKNISGIVLGIVFLLASVFNIGRIYGARGRSTEVLAALKTASVWQDSYRQMEDVNKKNEETIREYLAQTMSLVNMLQQLESVNKRNEETIHGYRLLFLGAEKRRDECYQIQFSSRVGPK
jgi:hypothetical protein